MPTGIAGVGAPDQIVYNPATIGYAVPTEWNEYGVGNGANLGTITEANAFFWQAEWQTAKNINRITFGGCYPNQPQATTKWKIEYRQNATLLHQRRERSR